MSGDVVRSYAPSVGGRRRRRGRSGCGGPVLGVLAALALLILIWVLYATRDAVPMHAVVPQGQAYRVLIPDLLRSRVALAESPVWQLAGEESPLASVPGQLSGTFGLPPWIVNNTLHGLTHVSGDDTAGFSDWLCVVRMSRIGTLLERFRGLSGEISADPAGGLALRHAGRFGMYYAVRGRLLLLSPSRNALIRALTLRPEDAIAEAALSLEDARAGGEDVLMLSAQVPETTPLGAYLSEVRLGLRLGAETVRIRAQLRPQAAVQARMPRLLAPQEGRALPAVAEGPLALSLHAGMPLAAAWEELRGGLALSTAPDGGEDAAGDPALALLRDTLWRGLGERAWVSWTGVAPLAMIPVPELVGGVTADAALAGLLEQLPVNGPVPSEGFDFTPRREADSDVTYLDFAGGPGMSPAVMPLAGQLLVSSSREALSRVSGSLPDGELPQRGLAYLRVRPEALAGDLALLGRELAAMGLFRGLDAPGYEAASAAWVRRAGALEEVAALVAGVSEDGIRMDLEARFSGGS